MRDYFWHCLAATRSGAEIWKWLPAQMSATHTFDRLTELVNLSDFNTTVPNDTLPIFRQVLTEPPFR